MAHYLDLRVLSNDASLLNRLFSSPIDELPLPLQELRVIKAARLKKYSALFKRNIAKFLTPGISIKTVIYPVELGGAVFEFRLIRDGIVEDKLEHPRKSISAVLSEIPQRMLAGNLEGVRFGGTNLYLEGNRILVIKGEDSNAYWTGNAVIEDVERVVSTSMGGGKTA